MSILKKLLNIIISERMVGRVFAENVGTNDIGMSNKFTVIFIFRILSSRSQRVRDRGGGGGGGGCLRNTSNNTKYSVKKKNFTPRKISFKGLKNMFDIKIDPYFMKIFI